MFTTTIALGAVCLAVLTVGAVLFGQPGFKIGNIGKIVAGFTVCAAVAGALAGGSALACILGAELGLIGGIATIFAIALIGKSGPY
ncbi:MAG: hypothetical protein K2W95_35480 [Candidatus Obscuribacterales bacterium]|nr:hypothetical protein [Candidatus Obscuribacterales bacterium]